MINNFSEGLEDCKEHNCPHLEKDWCNLWNDRILSIEKYKGEMICTELADIIEERNKPKPKPEKHCIIRDCNYVLGRGNITGICRKHRKMFKVDLIKECKEKKINTNGLICRQLLQKLVEDGKKFNKGEL
ncbi:MAG: hypothetical protein ACE5J3_08735 [Methanosarcinales archaeon]